MIGLSAFFLLILKLFQFRLVFRDDKLKIISQCIDAIVKLHHLGKITNILSFSIIFFY